MLRALLAPVLATVLALLTSSATTSDTGLPVQADKKDSTPQDPARFFIVAPERFHAELNEYVEHKRKLLNTELISLETTLKGSAGVDDPERLKRFLYEAWRKRNLKYVLLVGDVDVLPVRYMVLDRVTPAAFDYAFYPSDLYYSDLAKQDGTFDDWNAQKEGFHALYFGEVRGEKNKKDPINFDRIDYRPDVAVGRWPVSTPAEVRMLATKSLAYEKSILAGTHPGMRKAALFHVGGWVDGSSRPHRPARALSKGKVQPHRPRGTSAQTRAEWRCRLHRLHYREPAVRPHLARRIHDRAAQIRTAAGRRLLGERHQLLLRQRRVGPPEAER